MLEQKVAQEIRNSRARVIAVPTVMPSALLYIIFCDQVMNCSVVLISSIEISVIHEAATVGFSIDGVEPLSLITEFVCALCNLLLG
jgi:hypothetical protein